MNKPKPEPERYQSDAPILGLAAGGILIAVLVGAYFWLAVPMASPVPARARGVTVVKSTPANLDSRNNVSKSFSTSSTNPAYFLTRSLAVSTTSDHPLAKQTAEALVQFMRDESQIAQVEYSHYGERPKDGKLSPDLFIAVDVHSINHSSQDKNTLDAVVIAHFGTSLIGSHYSYNDHLTPPIVAINGEVRIEHKSTFTGVADVENKYTLQGKDIANPLAKSIIDTLKETRKKSSEPQSLPTGLVPEWRDAPEFAFLKTFEAEQLTSHNRLMSHNETFWKLRPIEDGSKMLVEISSELKGLGWKGQSDSGLPDHLHMYKEGKVLEVFNPSSHVTITADSGDSQQPTDGDSPTAQLSTFYVKYQDRMSREEISVVLEELLQEKPNTKLLLALHRYASGDLRQRIIEHFESAPTPDIETLLALSDFYAGRKDKEATIRVLNELHHLTYTTSNAIEIDQKISAHVTKLELDKEAIEKIDLAVFKKLGFVSLAQQPQQVEFSLSGSARFLLGDSSEKFLLVTCNVERLAQDAANPTYAVTFLQGGPKHGTSFSRTEGTRLDHEHKRNFNFGEQKVLLAAKKTDDGKIRVTATADTSVAKSEK